MRIIEGRGDNSVWYCIPDMYKVHIPYKVYGDTRDEKEKMFDTYFNFLMLKVKRR